MLFTAGRSTSPTGAILSWTTSFIRDMILQPNAHVVRGFDAIMPSYAGLVGDDELLRLSAYIRSLGRPENGDRG